MLMYIRTRTVNISTSILRSININYHQLPSINVNFNQSMVKPLTNQPISSHHPGGLYSEARCWNSQWFFRKCKKDYRVERFFFPVELTFPSGFSEDLAFFWGKVSGTLTKYHRNDGNPMELSQKDWNFSKSRSTSIAA